MPRLHPPCRTLGSTFGARIGYSGQHIALRLIRPQLAADRPQIEMVLPGADSEDAISVPHPVYFRMEPLLMERI